MSATVELTKSLIRKASITPDDAGCQKLIAERLEKLGFKLENMRFGDVDNLWARLGKNKPLVAFAGHTDVVPPGPTDAWHTDPFQPTIIDNHLYGRGAADMKSGLSAMIVATENFIQKNPNFKGSIAFLITSDEEGASIDGTKKVIETLEKRQEKINYCVVGEASSNDVLGDQIRVGRRGSLHGTLRINGKQGHVAYAHHALNPIHVSAKAFAELATEVWDEANEFPATTFQITNIQSGTGATNVIPGHLAALFNFRFGTAITEAEIKERVEAILQKHKLDYSLKWHLSGSPFLTKKGKLVIAAQEVIREMTGLDVILSTGGGTSDGRFIAPTGAEVIELGPLNASIHQANENINIDDLNKLTGIYESLLAKLLD